MGNSAHDPHMFADNLAKVAEQCQRIMQEFIAKQQLPHRVDPGPVLHLAETYAQWMQHVWQHPDKVVERQWQWWRDYAQLMQHTAERFMGEATAPVIAPDGRDKRFKDKAWQESTLFDFIKQSYLLNARYIQQEAAAADGLDSHTQQKIDFYTRQFIDAMAPSNFLLTNPEVLRTTLETGGQNLVEGLEHMLEDLARSSDTLRVSMTDEQAFTVGRNLAITPGKVVFQNALMQLIQYAPTTPQVHSVPLLIMPAWINKFYILDMQPENSMVKWLVEQGFTVFVISWVNPDARHAEVTFEDYMQLGPLEAMRVIRAITQSPKLHIAGYCLGGTLLAITLAYLAAQGKAEDIASATYFTTMVDFSEAGELSVFIDEEQLQDLERKMAETGYLEGKEMATTFNLLRANDLIWSFVVNNYLLGRDPFPFDLLYWNSDSTRMPARMHSFYLRNMYQHNRLVVPGGLNMRGVPIDLTRITTPSYILSTREDHIAPWKSTYAATKHYQGETAFVLAASGHIAGAINPPVKQKYSYWVNPKLADTPDAWLTKAEEKPGSWWPHWVEWLAPRSGKKCAARTPGSKEFPPLEDAPGSYVRVKS